jgi:hypothetical protein
MIANVVGLTVLHGRDGPDQSRERITVKEYVSQLLKDTKLL